jgi:hypothetical protein
VTASIETTHRVLAWRLAAGASAIAAVLACASPPPSVPYQEQLSRWEGESEANLVTTWGMPYMTHPLADGGRILEYRNGDDRSCTTRFTLDSTGKIVRWWYAGRGCAGPQTG